MLSTGLLCSCDGARRAYGRLECSSKESATMRTLGRFDRATTYLRPAAESCVGGGALEAKLLIHTLTPDLP